jgi:hypothetical protein
MKELLVVCIELHCGGVFADGVLLITPGPPIKALSPMQAEQAKLPAFVKYHPVVINKDALTANVVTVMIDGKEYRFVGSLGPTVPGNPPYADKAAPRQPDQRSWSGRMGKAGDPDYGQLFAILSSDGEVTGSISLPPARGFSFTSRWGLMTESDYNKAR